jgi:hypothetical protein
MTRLQQRSAVAFTGAAIAAAVAILIMLWEYGTSLLMNSRVA